MKKIVSLGFIALTILFSACSSDDNDDKGIENNNSVTAVVNGAEWKPTKINSVTLIKIPGMGQRFDINIQDDSQMFMLACENETTTANAMPLKDYNFYDDNENTDEDESLASNALFINSYLIDGNTYTEHQPVSGKITITAMDPDKKTVSGTFSFKTVKVGVLQSKVVTPEVIEVKNGVFTNLSYTVYAQ
ncbi:DUF6252 family protein [Flavobacterium gelatinilyticum]|uniref:DUF6252 family protein n=1 Tax=Flavobacterium gelatinilyticum TaxID=3003260 RepID=UPI00247FFD97|nr:DUF6252 family protein [Flavobacterium gelatinilyticum]